jgi:hypothetical protein
MDDQAKQVEARPVAVERTQGSGAAALGCGRRMSRQRKTAAVLRLLREKDLETVSRDLASRPQRLAGCARRLSRSSTANSAPPRKLRSEAPPHLNHLNHLERRRLLRKP